MAQPAFRREFASSPAQAVERAGITENIPQAQLEVLAKLSAEELEIVTSVLDRLRKAAPGRVLSL